MRISDWSSDVCSSDLSLPGVARHELAPAARPPGAVRPGPQGLPARVAPAGRRRAAPQAAPRARAGVIRSAAGLHLRCRVARRIGGLLRTDLPDASAQPAMRGIGIQPRVPEQRNRELWQGDWDREATHSGAQVRSEEHTSELQSLMRITDAVFCLKKNTIATNK